MFEPIRSSGPLCHNRVGQHKGTLIAQNLKSRVQCGAMEVWFSEAGLSSPQEENGWVFGAVEGAYATVRPVSGGDTWRPSQDAVSGVWLRCGDEWTPVILEVARSVDFADCETFCDAVTANELTYGRSVLTYCGLNGRTPRFLQ